MATTLNDMRENDEDEVSSCCSGNVYMDMCSVCHEHCSIVKTE